MKSNAIVSSRVPGMLAIVVAMGLLSLFPLLAPDCAMTEEVKSGTPATVSQKEAASSTNTAVEKELRLTSTQSVGYILGGKISKPERPLDVDPDSLRAVIQFELPRELHVARAVLRLYAVHEPTSAPFHPWTLLVCPALDDWSEKTIAQGHGPAFRSPLGTSVAPETGNGWHALDVTDFVTEKARTDGKVSFLLMTLNAIGKYESCKGEHAPELVITLGDVSTKRANREESPFVLKASTQAATEEKSEDWPQFLGPHRNGVTTTTAKLATSWPAEGPPVLWTYALGTPGRNSALTRHGGPVVKDGRVYILDSDAKGAQEVIRCLNLETGEQLWSYAYDQPVFSVGHGFFHTEGNTPIVDEEHVYTFGPAGNLVCLDRKTGALVWSHRYIRETDASRVNKREEWTDFANGVTKGAGYSPDSQCYAQCPLLYGKAVIVAPQRSDVGLVAHDRMTGEVIWKSPSIGGITQTSPTLVNVEGRDMILMFGRHCDQVKDSRFDGLYAIDPRNGAIILEVRLPDKQYTMMSTISALSEGRIVWAGQHFHHFTTMFQFRLHSDNLYAVEIWRQFPMRSKVSLQPIIPFKDHLFLSEQNHGGYSKFGFACLDMQANVCWATWTLENFERNTAYRFGETSPFIIVNDRIFILDDNAGEGVEGFALVMIAADPGEYRLMAACTGFAKGRLNIHSYNRAFPMAYSRGKLLAAFNGQLRCWDLTEK